MELTFKERIALYILMKKNENHLNHSLNDLFRRIERELYDQLTLNQIQNIDNYFNSLED